MVSTQIDYIKTKKGSTFKELIFLAIYIRSNNKANTNAKLI